MNVWIQYHDFSHKDFPGYSFEEACHTLERFDWKSEMVKQKKLGKYGRESCEAGMGFIAEDGRILHIIPCPKGCSVYHYHFPDKKRFLGIFPREEQETVSKADLPDKHRKLIIESHYGGRHGEVLELLNTHGREW